MHTVLNCDLCNFQNDRSNVAIMWYIQTGEIFGIFSVIQHLCTVYLKADKVSYLKQIRKDAKIPHV